MDRNPRNKAYVKFCPKITQASYPEYSKDSAQQQIASDYQGGVLNSLIK